MKKHYSVCYNRTKYIFPGGFYVPPVTIFNKLKSLGITFDKDLEFYNKFVVWDMEAELIKQKHICSIKFTWISKYVPVSVSIGSQTEDIFANIQSEIRCDLFKSVSSLKRDFLLYISQQNVIGFNSGRYCKERGKQGLLGACCFSWSTP